MRCICASVGNKKRNSNHHRVSEGLSSNKRHPTKKQRICIYILQNTNGCIGIADTMFINKNKFVWVKNAIHII